MQAPASLTLRPAANTTALDENQRLAIYASGGWVAFVLLSVMVLNLAWSVNAARVRAPRATRKKPRRRPDRAPALAVG